MALRGNAQAIEKEIDIKQVRTQDNADDGGINCGRELNNFVDGFMSHDEAQLSGARQVLVDVMGAAGMVEAAAVAGNFQRMVRIADAIGIPIDEARLELSTGLREELGLNEFHSAQNTLNRQ